MRTFTFFTILLLGFFTIITAIARPEVLKSKYAEIRAPIDKYYAEKNSEIWRDAKKSEQAMWMLKLHLPSDCLKTKSAIRELECKNIIQLHSQTFEQNWSVKVASGWKPEGASY